MNKKISTGNYDFERTKFNIHYKDINKSNLYQEIKSILEDRNIKYFHKTKTNILNSITFTNCPEFFMILGLLFKKTDKIEIFLVNYKSERVAKFEAIATGTLQMYVDEELSEKLVEGVYSLDARFNGEFITTLMKKNKVVVE